MDCQGARAFPPQLQRDGLWSYHSDNPKPREYLKVEDQMLLS